MGSISRGISSSAAVVEAVGAAGRLMSKPGCLGGVGCAGG